MYVKKTTPKVTLSYAYFFLFTFLFPFISLGQGNTHFESLASKKTGVKFKNKLTEDEKHNILTYEYFYNGGGIAIGDLDNDGLDDIFLTGNMVPNKLYHNQGNFRFKDISKTAGISGKDSWTTGVSMTDINADGLLDIYVCFSGEGDAPSRKNELYINQGNLVFEEQAAQYGLDDASNSTQALFFDFDKDGDLDMYLLNHHIKVIHELEFDEARSIRHESAGDKLFRNDNGRFVDISEAAGIKGNALGFGLGVVASDVNNDGWQDLYVCNDYIEQDYLYINNQDGTFTEQLTSQLQHISHFSMGLDIADINNDGLKDIFTLDMLPEDNQRQKLLYGPENYEQYALMVMEGFYHQNMRNMLHLNQGNNTFSEIGQLAGVSNTDWSWSSLFFDIDNDGFKDLFITNGYYRDYTNRDFLKYKGDYYFKKAISREQADTLSLVTSMTSTPIPNYAFQNNGDLTFTNRSKEWGIDQPGFSNGAAYADLDNDGFLDLVVNNLNEVVSLYRNTPSGKEKSHYLKINLRGEGKNTFGTGAKITIYTQSGQQTLEQMPTRGFQSSVSHQLHFGIGKDTEIDSLKIDWLSGKSQTLRSISADQTLTLKESDAKGKPMHHSPNHQPLYQTSASPIPYEYKESGFNDFKRQPLLMEMPSYLGPIMALDSSPDGDLLFVGGTKGKPGMLYKSGTDNAWVTSRNIHLEDDYSDADALFLDANLDGHADLYIASGGYHNYTSEDENLQDRLYLNDGKGNFTRDLTALPVMPTSTSVVCSADFNKDGYPDVFSGGRIVPGKYPEIPKSYLLLNDGKGKFQNASDNLLPELNHLGMVTDASCPDINGDGYEDLIIVGECLPIQVYINQSGKGFKNETSQWLKNSPHGLWSSLAMGDFDQDGDIDFIVGNFGLNSQLRASTEEPMTMYYGDFDENGSIDPLMVRYIQGEAYPFASRDELLDQMYGLRSKFTDYASYSTAKIEDILSKSQLNAAKTLTVNELKTMYLENTGNSFTPHDLPVEAQFAPVYSIGVLDFDDDGHLDFILGGNQTYTRLRIGVMDANYGQVFLGNGKGQFSYLPQQQSGLSIKGDVKSILPLQHNNTKLLLFGLSNQGIIAYQKNIQP
ncbi:VCBS repeat-containing protein [Echinicola sediminis]